jgi:outer membrane protein TolC
MHELGSTSGLVLAQNQTTVDTARGDVAGYTSQVDRDRNALQLLVGGRCLRNCCPPPRPWGAADTAALKVVPVPLPSSVLLKRPDVQAAERNLQAMNANIGGQSGAVSQHHAHRQRRYRKQRAGPPVRQQQHLEFHPLVKLPIFDGGATAPMYKWPKAISALHWSQYEKTVQTAFKRGGGCAGRPRPVG